MSESTCPRCGGVAYGGVRLEGVTVPGTAADQVVFYATCNNPGCGWRQERHVA
ncbi:MAG: hypothetical protein ACRDO1_20475 [Nocardioidaceae bacterium]